MKRNTGIAMVSLVVTIIVLIILAGVSINTLIGENGIIEQAKRAKEVILNAQLSEERQLNDLYSELMIATNDDSKITISMEDLNKLIDERIENKLQEYNKNEYSLEEERIVGTWVDGKSIYRRVYYITSPVADGQAHNVVNISNLNLDFVVDIRAIGIGKNNAIFPIPTPADSNVNGNREIFTSEDRKYICMRMGNGSMTNFSEQPCYIFLEYTKITD